MINNGDNSKMQLKKENNVPDTLKCLPRNAGYTYSELLINNSNLESYKSSSYIQAVGRYRQIGYST